MKLAFVTVPAAILVGGALGAPGPPTHAVDHVGLGCSDLERGIAFVAERTGVRAEMGGVHPGRGTHNALMSLGGGAYLEIIAPVPGGKPEGEDAGLADLATPKPVFFAVRSTDLDATARVLAANGFKTADMRPGSRKRPDGSVLEWRTLRVTGAGLDVAPFFIEWSRSSPHPSTTSPEGCAVTALEVEDKDTAALAKLFKVLGLDVATRTGSAPSLRLKLSCGKKEVVLGP